MIQEILKQKATEYLLKAFGNEHSKPNLVEAAVTLLTTADPVPPSTTK